MLFVAHRRRHRIKLFGGITDLYFEGDMEASVANTGQVSSRIIDLQPASQIVKQTWSEIETALGESRSRLGQRGAGQSDWGAANKSSSRSASLSGCSSGIQCETPGRISNRYSPVT